MEYSYLFNDIYRNYKEEKEFSKIKKLNFIKENNTKIVNFIFNDDNLKNIKGALVEQNHLVIIYFQIKYNNDNYLFLKKAYINQKDNSAIIYSCLCKNGNILEHEIREKYYKDRKELFNITNKDNIINNMNFNEYDSFFDINIDSSKKITKRL